MDCHKIIPPQVGFPGVQTIARLRRRVRRQSKRTTEIVYLISSLTLEELDAASFLKLKRGYWVIESRLHHALDVSLGEDHSRVRHPPAAFVLSLFRRVVVSFAQVWLVECRKIKPRSRATTRKFQKRFLHRDGGPARLQALVFAKSPLYVANSQARWRRRFLLWRMTLPSLCDDERSSCLARAPFGLAGKFAGHPRNQSCRCRKPNLEAAAPGDTAVPTSGT